MPSQLDLTQIATILVGGRPLDCKAYPDGSLVVIAPNGQKFHFTPQQVSNIQASCQYKEKAKSSGNPQERTTSRLPAKPAAKEKPKTSPERSSHRKSS